VVVDVKKHAANDLGSSGLENSILLVDAGEEGVIKSEHEHINYNHKEPKETPGVCIKSFKSWQKRTRIRKS
jgi:hypothetical protein